MKIIHTIDELHQKLSSKTLGLVPTMGNLHLGHASLLEKSRAENEISALSIFVNPTQFNQSQDFASYPRTLEADLSLAKNMGVDIVFVPKPEELYPDEYSLQIHETQDSIILEGAHRPGHFAGMLTVVLKLLMLFMPTRAYFGEKDFQQFYLIRKMQEAFFLPIEIIPCPTVRDENGLALSSRNSRLSPTEKATAIQFANILAHGKDCEAILKSLQSLPLTIDYVSDWQNRRLAAVTIGQTRLIDNVPQSLVQK